MKTAAAIAVATLALGAMLWAADDAVVAPQPVANRQSLVANRSDAVTIPQVLSYQGRLTDATGAPVPDGEYSITFKLYTQPSGGSPFWNETQKVTTRDGLFSVLLGAVTPIRTKDEGRGTRDEGLAAAYLGMTVEGSEEMTPRLRVAGTYVLPSERVGANDNKGGGTDNDDEWVRSSPADSVLYTIRRLGIARGGCGNVLYGDWKCSMTNLGSSCTTGISGSGGASLGNMAVLGGYGNRAWAPYTSVGGGRNNRAGNDATDTSAIVVGGYGNKATNKFSAVIAGQNNTASGAYSTVAGGYGTTADSDYATAGGGLYNHARGPEATVGGGEYNTASGRAATVGGGDNNAATNYYATVAGGAVNTASGTYSTVGGGYNNAASDTDATVGGGYQNVASDPYATVAGGIYNTASVSYATVGGGYADSASTKYATVGGGYRNTASTNFWSTVCGGYCNRATGEDAVVAGGEINVASGYDATVGGGGYNTASANYATVPGGYNNTASGTCGFATGSGSSDGGYGNSAAFNGVTATAASQVRCSNLNATGTKNFAIDHPLDPDGRILNHYCIESPEVVNLYRGAAVLGPDGRAKVQLPDYFSAENVNPMIQLTGVGSADVVYVAEKVAGNSFVIGGKPGTEVFWTVTADRNDQSARIGQLLTPVEQPKTGTLAGRSLDDDYLAGCMQQLAQMGKAGEFHFRTAAGKQRHENMLKMLREAGQHQSKQVVEPKPAQPAAQPDKLQQR